MPTQIQVSDTRGKYPTKTYTVEVDPKEPFLAEMDAVQRFIAEVGHPPYVVGKSARAYYSRFYVETVKAPVVSTVPCKVKLVTQHDRLALTASWPNGQKLAVSISRSGERVSGTASTAELRAVHAWVSAVRTDETYAQRFARLAALCEGTMSVAEIVGRLAAPVAVEAA